MKGKITINSERCKACFLCVEVCKKGGIQKGNALNQAGYVSVIFDPECECNGCALCAIRCPEAAIEVYRDK